MTAEPDSPPSHHRPGGSFRNPWPGIEAHGLGDLLRWQKDRIHGTPADPPRSSFVRATPHFPVPRSGPDDLFATWVGHSTVLLQLGAMNVLTDPIWSERASPLSRIGPKRWVEPGVEMGRLPPLDLVLLSHNHYDHLDEPTVRRLAKLHPAARWVAPLGLASRLQSWGVSRAAELDWWQSLHIAGATITCTPAQHFSARGLRDRNRTLWCGYAVRAGSHRVFFAGDTGYHPEFGRIGAQLGPFDLALIPIGAYAPRWFMRSVHMDPDEAVSAYTDVRTGHPTSHPAMLPIHWGTFKLTDEPMDEPPLRLRAAWHHAALDPAKLWLLEHGETRKA
ncbi:MAG: MBL fold metallo-hydrolase [Gemmatimonadota bacterium]|nr:MBL fold metallo-hydrolase [Gemmatimonadota bacterium]